MLRVKSKLPLLVTIVLVCSLFAASSLVFEVKAATATSLTLTITPTTVEHSSASQPVALCDISISLTASGTGLAGRPISLYWRAVGDTTWNTIITVTTDGSGQYSASDFPPEMIVGGGTGDYEFKASYTPAGADIGVYDTSESAVVIITINPHTLEATTTILTLNPSIVEHSSASQPVVLCDISVSLTAGGTGLAGRFVTLYWRAVGSSIWNTIITVTMDGSGQWSASDFPPEIVVGGVCGDYELKAEYVPNPADATDYIGSEDTCTFTVLPASNDMTIVIIYGHTAFADHSSSTGMTVSISGDSLPDGFSFTVTTEKFGATLPPGTAYFAAANNIFYDIKVVPTAGGSVGPDVMVTIQITDDSFDSTRLVYYWPGSGSWQAVTSTFVAPHTISFTVPASMLAGTPFVVFSPPIFAVPEYPLGALFAIGACFIALIAFKVIKNRK